LEINSQTTDCARIIVNTLASEKYMGRGYCEKADRKSAEYIRNEFRKFEITGLGQNYFQYFNIDANCFPRKMSVKIGDLNLIPGVNYLIDPSSPSIKGLFKVIAVRKNELLNKKTLRQILDSSFGKALLIDLTGTIYLSVEEEDTVQKIIDAIKYDLRVKNSLTIIFTDKELTWSTSDWQAKKGILVINSSGLNPTEITEIEVNIQASFKKNYKTRNVIGMISGKIEPDSFLVITAHYDHLGIMGKNTYFPGANDNASGVAMMLNLCKYFAENPPKYSVIFIAFSAEELGLIGSDYFVRNPLFELKNTRFLINFDLAGTGDEGIKVVNASVFKTEFEKLQQINNQNNYLPSVQPRGEACNSDHCFFYKKNVPCFYIYTLGGISAYHDINDKPETLPLTEFEDYTRLMISFLKSF
jgi:hypothetical protein